MYVYIYIYRRRFYAPKEKEMMAGSRNIMMRVPADEKADPPLTMNLFKV